MDGRFRLVQRPGVTVAVVNGSRVLILKRRNLPLMVNRGIWYFVGGSRKDGETLLQNAFREVFEELHVKRSGLSVISSFPATIRDRRKLQRWGNTFFVMASADRKIKLNLEHTGYRWVSPGSLDSYKDLLGALEDSGKVMEKIKSAIRKSGRRR